MKLIQLVFAENAGGLMPKGDKMINKKPEELRIIKDETLQEIENLKEKHKKAVVTVEKLAILINNLESRVDILLDTINVLENQKGE
jgi:hypothetical protein